MSFESLRGLSVHNLGSGLSAELVGRVLADLGAVAAGDPATDLRGADVVIVGGEDHPGRFRPSPEALFAQSPRTIVVDILGDAEGSHAQPAVDILAQARTGLAFENSIDRPRLMALPAPSYGAALQALIGVSAALLERQHSGCGQIVRTSLQQGAVFFAHSYWMAAETPDAAFDLGVPKGARAPIVRCADGRLVHIHPAGGATAGIRSALDIAPDARLGARDYFGDIDTFQEKARSLTSEDLLERLRRHGVTCEEALPPGACWDDPQVVANARIRTEPDGVRRPATPIAIIPHGPAGEAPPPSDRGPFAGLRVLDFGHYIAGCYPSRVLADLGAEVIKIEAPAGEGMRRASLRVVHSANAGKTGLAVDLKSPEGIALVHELVRDADVVTHNFRLGVAERLGLDPASLRRINPRLVTLEGSSYGPIGPKAAHPSFDPILVSYAGHAVRAGGRAGAPFWYRNFVVDYAAGALGAVGLLLGLLESRRTGRAVEVRTDLLGAALFLASDLRQDADGRWNGDPPLDDDLLGRGPAQRLYQTADGWIAVAVADAEMARRLAGALRITLGALDDWGAAEQAEIAKAFRLLSSEDALARLADADVWSAPCRDDGWAALVEADQAAGGGLICETRDARYGAVRAPAPQYTLSRTPQSVRASAPAVGEHTRLWLERLGRSAAQIEALIATGVVATAPASPTSPRGFVEPRTNP